MRPLTAMQVLRAKLEVPTSRPLLEPVLEHDRFRDLSAMYWLLNDEDERLKREAYGDLGEMLRHAERLLRGEFLDEPIHSTDMHARHVQVIVLAISSLLHPKKMRNPPKGSREYNDLARRRIARWFWAATFSRLRLDNPAVEAEAEALVSWARSRAPSPPAPPPQVVVDMQAPPVEWLDEISYRKKDWRYWAVLALLARSDPCDPLTGQRISVERLTGSRIQGDHVFPQKWLGWEQQEAPQRRDSIVNIAAITQYTNIWKGKRSPSEYVRDIVSLGVPEERLRLVFTDHLVDVDDLLGDDWTGFYVKRRKRIHDVLVNQLTSET